MPEVQRKDALRANAQGFTLIELLKVIAIIAILTAIIFPVFATIRENNRQSSSLSNLHDISSKLYAFQLDKHAYPDVLFGYAYPNVTSPIAMDKALEAAQTQANTLTTPALQQSYMLGYFPGLYPEYISNVAEFQDGNNQAALNVAVDPTTNVLCPSVNPACTGAVAGTLVVADHSSTTGGHGFYTADAFDSSPKVTGANTIDLGTPITRYQPAWTSVPQNNGANPPAGVFSNATITAATEYARQLHWKFPPPDAYVTCTTYHMTQANKVLVLFAGGNAKKWDYTNFVAHGADTDIGANSGVSASPIWTVLPSGQ